ncbi:hypothetical protein HPB50_005075 [Hyalomma asiaticum]|uniref:Uncharacterized protein n=1 Tax=Hyalomma asiaticum TaxID=266040 RepID=A0ACB7SKB9_HYAAI|nr:hypothetical protein HPB50_005075 [Hyalomma asiaticum]
MVCAMCPESPSMGPAARAPLAIAVLRRSLRLRRWRKQLLLPGGLRSAQTGTGSPHDYRGKRKEDGCIRACTISTSETWLVEDTCGERDYA